MIFTILGAGGAALAYNANQPTEEALPTTPETLANSHGNAQQHGQPADKTGIGEPQVADQGMAGEAWETEGIITALDDYGFDLLDDNGESVYIELGPPDFWLAQGVNLTTGLQVSVTGSINEGNIHAAQVQTAGGQTLVVRSENEHPLLARTDRCGISTLQHCL